MATHRPDIDKQIQEMALTHRDELMAFVDKVKFTICMERKKGKSYNQIAIVVRTNKSKVQRVCKICPKADKLK